MAAGGGFDCEFVDPPPSVIQTECAVCLLVLREPYLTSCCGHSFCRECIELVQREDHKCPLCNEVGFTVMRDKRLERTLKELDVSCTFLKSGCDWVGKLGHLEKHISKDGGTSKPYTVCGYVTVDCEYKCGESFQRRNVTSHECNDCPKRPYSCDYCREHSGTFEDVVYKHYPVCGVYPLSCPNRCDHPYAIERQNLERHIENECSLAITNCDFHQVGCEVKLPRKDMNAHLNEDIVVHLSLLAVSNSRLIAANEDLVEKLAKKDQEISALTAKLDRAIEEVTTAQTQFKTEFDTVKKDNVTLKSDSDSLKGTVKSHDGTILALCSLIGLPPFTVTMANFSSHKASKEVWYSPPFHSHPRGYKMCVAVHASSNAGTHVSVYIHHLEGEYDDDLKWPFRGRITMQLLNQQSQGKDEDSYEHVIHCNEELPDSHAGRVSQDSERGGGYGKPTFISHDELEPRFLKGDTLYFLVTKVETETL